MLIGVGIGSRVSVGRHVFPVLPLVSDNVIPRGGSEAVSRNAFFGDRLFVEIGSSMLIGVENKVKNVAAQNTQK